MKYRGEKTRCISFPLGGIGSGSIGITGNGELMDAEMFNRPAKSSRLGDSHFAIKVKDGDKRLVRVLHGDTNEPFMGTHSDQRYSGIGFGPSTSGQAGLPHFRSVEFDGSFPIAELTYRDGDFPIEARLTAFNPFIPHEEDESSLPAAFFSWELKNTTDRPLEVALYFSATSDCKGAVHREVTDGDLHGLRMWDTSHGKSEVEYREVCIMTDHPDVAVQEYWYRGRWQDARTTYWNNINEDARLRPRNYADSHGGTDHGTVAAYLTIPAGQSRDVRFILAWYAPNRCNDWNSYEGGVNDPTVWRNYYAVLFDGAVSVAKHALVNYDSLYRRTREFTDALHGSTLPDFVTDAVTANLSVLKSPTVLRLENGSLWGWEGVMERVGSCPGSCQHVWNYAYALPYLFPRLERSLRENTLEYGMDEKGRSAFRVPLPLGAPLPSFRACLDGQMGEVIKFYREWKISGDGEWLRKYSERVFKLLEYAWSPENPDCWDRDMDGVLEGRQHHTLDMELFGPSSWLQGFYVLALNCAAEMADALGQTDRAEKYLALAAKGRKFLNGELFNGRYFHQLVDLGNKGIIDRFGAEEYWNEETEQIKWQLGEGCIIDQMLADYHAALIGIEGVFDKDKKLVALDSLYENNFKPSMRDVVNIWRLFALNDEAGTVICSYPEGAQVPSIPIPYCDETMTGFEYALAVLMIANGMVEQGETMVKAVRDRYDGERRNPFNEIECGSNYARSMASYALLNVYSGFKYDMRHGYLGFYPLAKGRYFFSVAESWGVVILSDSSLSLEIKGAPLTLSALGMQNADKVKSLTVDGTPVIFGNGRGELVLDGVTVRNSLTASL